MSITPKRLADELVRLGRIEPAIARAVEEVGIPELAPQMRGYGRLLRTIVGQRISVASALAAFTRLEAAVGDIHDPVRLLALSDEEFQATGLSRQKISHARSLAEHIVAGSLDLDALPETDEEAIAALMDVRGVGRWSAEIYLLLAEGRYDIWPAGDLAVRISVGRMLQWNRRPEGAELRRLAEPWQPHRSAAALLAFAY